MAFHFHHGNAALTHRLATEPSEALRSAYHRCVTRLSELMLCVKHRSNDDTAASTPPTPPAHLPDAPPSLPPPSKAPFLSGTSSVVLSNP